MGQMKHILKFASQAALAAALLSTPAFAFAQARGELHKRMYDEKGEPIPESRKEVCKRRYDEKYAACVSRALQNTNLSASDRSYYKRCSERFQAGYQQCLARPETSPETGK
ncbi:MAG: hypothetical protein V3V56_10420 [bacterium]